MANEIVIVENESQTEQSDKDFIKSRDAIHSVLEVSQTVAKETADLAYQSQAPAYYRVLNEILRTRIEAAKELIELHKKKRELNGKEPPRSVTNQNLIVTSSDLLNMIRTNQEKKEEIVYDTVKQR